jgi:hypothetical protein
MTLKLLLVGGRDFFFRLSPFLNFVYHGTTNTPNTNFEQTNMQKNGRHSSGCFVGE